MLVCDLAERFLTTAAKPAETAKAAETIGAGVLIMVARAAETAKAAKTAKQQEAKALATATKAAETAEAPLDPHARVRAHALRAVGRKMRDLGDLSRQTIDLQRVKSLRRGEWKREKEKGKGKERTEK
jgi:uncharacterized transporter YbjL